MMRKNTIQFVFDILAFLFMLTLAATGLLMELVLPPGSGGKTLWGLGRHAWGDVHFWVAVGLLVVIVVHLALHWTWVVCTLRRLNPFRGERARPGPHDAAWGVGLLAAVVVALGALVLVGRSQVVSPPPGAESAEHGEHE